MEFDDLGACGISISSRVQTPRALHGSAYVILLGAALDAELEQDYRRQT